MDGRQPPSDDHATPSNSRNPNVFDDEYALERDQDPEFGMGVADGFRPGNDHGGGIAGNSTTALDHRASIRSSVRHSISENFPLDTKGPPQVAQQRNSISKGGHAARGSFTMAQDGPNSSTPERSNTYSPAPRLPQLSHRASIASTSSFATEHASQSGFAANSGPSHPYGMYPQGTGLGRSASVTTTSTAQGTSRSLSHHGPAHPYAMYPQNVFDDPDEIRPAPVQNQIPVGFPGLGQGYHRQIGPDGEEQDIIGPDGHMEQLPPYSRFPEEGPTKASLMAVPEEFGLVTGTETAHTAAPAATSGVAAGAAVGSLAASPVGPHSASMSQEALPSSNSSMMMQPMANGQTTPQSQEPLQSQDRSASAEAPSSTGAPNDKSWSEKSWQEKRKTKILWGKVPLWVFITALVIIVILAVILGVVIGTFMAKGHMDKNKDRGPSMVTVVSTESLFDASSIQVIPTGLPALPVGKYALPIRSPDVSSNECLTSSEQNDAWSCNVDGPPLEINVRSYGKANSYAMWLSPLDNTTGVNYGSQAPNIEPQALSLVTDLDNPTDGPAWHFQTLYDKIVILRPEDFAAGQKLVSRDAHSSSSGDYGGDDGSSSYPPYPPDGFNMPSGFRSRHQVVAGDKPWYCIWNSTFIETFIYVEQNTSAAMSTGVSSGLSSATSYATPAQSTSTVPATTTYPSPVTIVSTNTAAAITTSPSTAQRRDTDSDNIQWYPRIVKIEERRTSTKEQAYCQQMQLLDDGRMVPVLQDGQTIVVKLSESDPDYSDYKSGSSSKSSKRALDKRDDPSNACHCQWSFI
ncbi:hypothetical protein DBV05_g5421 [Lasiodiplodia theobromae]|uniref:DUF7820 domain-containing protein n=1 Tax=Lasiodiplodia theobromae TaxID=45133 RepID=A0A5N5DFZ8_9PEZI|nr:hypothetical protein DBV05_g5421 [Lasiodiplodia theobromae]